MAELVGVVASGISIATLAAQIANSVIKLKGYWKETPEDIRLLIEEVEDVQFILSDIEEDQRCNPILRTASVSISASRCLERCKRGADLLKNLADELGAEITSISKRKKAWASAKVILKKDRLEKYKLQLEHALRVLTLSYQSYTVALMRLQPDMIVSRLTHPETNLSHLESLLTSVSLSASPPQGNLEMINWNQDILLYSICEDKWVDANALLDTDAFENWIHPWFVGTNGFNTEPVDAYASTYTGAHGDSFTPTHRVQLAWESAKYKKFRQTWFLVGGCRESPYDVVLGRAFINSERMLQHEFS